MGSKTTHQPTTPESKQPPPEFRQPTLKELLQLRDQLGINQGPPAGLSPKEAAHRLGNTSTGWTAKRIRRLCRLGRIPAILHNSQWFVEKEWVEDMVKKIDDEWNPEQVPTPLHLRKPKPDRI